MRFKAPLHSCASCDGLLPSNAESCPHCGAGSKKGPGSKKGGKIAGAAAVAVAGAGFAVTLMACYGPPPREYEKVDAPQPPSAAGAASDGGVAPDMPKAK